ncbi:hypothetical protein [Xanthomonas arboricola]|uniref:hypothetical protein n=1 Tax=Xanthomonas arboricola TaxID=56448 RepID=UPI0011B0BAC6|nr:hypothetical protein [Xanthomonas arboricola]
MHENAKRLLARYPQTAWDVGCIAIVNFIKTLAELITLAALFEFVAQKFKLPLVGAFAWILTLMTSIYIGNRISLILTNEIYKRWPNFKHALWIALPINLTLAGGVMLGARELVKGLILKELGS